MSDGALRVARGLAADMDPQSAAARCGVEFVPGDDGGSFKLRFLGEDVTVGFPDFEFDPLCTLPPHVRALIVYYLAPSEGSGLLGEWTAFADLPGGRFYSQAFQGYTGNALARRVGDRSGALPAAIASLGGRRLRPEELATNADAAWLVPALPRVPVAVVWWDADDEFSARAELLFDRTATQHLPIDGCAVLGSWLTTCLAANVERAG